MHLHVVPILMLPPLTSDTFLPAATERTRKSPAVAPEIVLILR